MLVVEAVSNKLIKLRSPLQEFRWTGDWSRESRLWDQKLKQQIGKEHFEDEEDPRVFWMSQ